VLREGAPIDLPHSWNQYDTFQKGVSYYRGTGTYVRRFEMPRTSRSEGQRWLLSSEGFYGIAEVFLNRRLLRRLDGQYLGFRLDVTDFLGSGKLQELAIRLKNRCPPSVLPGTSNPDFLLMGGLAGEIHLELEGSSCFHGRRAEISPEDVLSPNPRIDWQIPARVQSGDLHLQVSLQDSKGARIAQTRESLPSAPAEQSCRGSLGISDPHLWSPEKPYLYTLEFELFAGRSAVDSAVFRVGLRHILFDREGFHLNGSRYSLQGFNRHQSAPGLGNALPNWMHVEDAERFKAYGANLVRLSHYPQHPVFLDACDRLGLFVYSEIASWKTARGGRWQRSALSQMEAMIRRDRHRPSVLFWGMGNEAQHLGAYRALAELVHELDPGRPVTYAESHFYRGRRAGLPGIPDVWSCNYDIASLDEQHEASTTGAVLVSECCNDQAEKGNLEEEVEQAERQIALWKAIEHQPFVVGYALWSFADYATLYRKRFTRHTGKFDCWRLPKIAAAVFRARHHPSPFLRVFGSWSHEGPAQREVAIVTNCTDLSLELGSNSSSLDQGDWLGLHEVGFEPMTLKVSGQHPLGAVHDELDPWGPAARVIVRPDRQVASAADRDWVGVGIELVDDQGRQVRDARGDAYLSVDSHLRLGSLDERGRVLIRSGEGRTFVRASGQPGKATLRVRVAGCSDGIGYLELTAESSETSRLEL
jgi:beta-galactosidase